MPRIQCPRPANVSDEQIVAKLIWGQQHPDLWVEEVFGISLHSYQREALQACALHDRVLMCCGHGVGKSFAEACVVLWWLFTSPSPKAVITGPSMRQVEDDVLAAMHFLMRRFDFRRAHFYGSYVLKKTRLELSPDVFATGETSESGGTIEGYHAPYMLYDIDEAKEVPETVYDSIDGALTSGRDTGGRSLIFMASTPGPCSGRFWRAATGLERGWYVIRVNSEKSPQASKDWLRYMSNRHGEGSAEYNLRVRGEFDERAGSAVITVDETKYLHDARLEPQVLALPELGIDVARKGSNRTVFTMRRGPCVLAMMDRHHRDTVWVAKKAMELVDHVAAEYGVGRRRIKIKVDDSVTGDVPVFVRRGYRWLDIVPIASLHKKDSTIYSKHDGYEILSGTGWTRVKHAIRHKVNKRLYDVVTHDGRTRVTEDHSLIVGGVETKPTELAIDDVIDTVRPEWNNLDRGISPELARVLGFFIAEGSLSYHKQNQLLVARIAQKDRSLLDGARSVLGEFFCESGSISGPDKMGMHSLKLGKTARDFVERACYETVNLRTWKPGYGRTTEVQRYKKVPMQVLNGAAEIKQAFIRGYMEGDGYISEREWKSDTKDLCVAAGLQYLYESLGLTTRVRVRDDKPAVTTIAKVKKGYGLTGQVKRVRPLGAADGYVYDLETESHTFVAGVGFLVHHNTGVGGGITDALRHAGYNVTGITAAASPHDDEHFRTRRDELWFAIRDRIRERRLCICGVPRILREELLGELNAPNYRLDGERFIVEQKHDTEKRIKKSPDLADSLILSFAGPDKQGFIGKVGVRLWKQRQRSVSGGQAERQEKEALLT